MTYCMSHPFHRYTICLPPTPSDPTLPTAPPHADSDSKVHGANMGPTRVLSAPDGPHVPCISGESTLLADFFSCCTIKPGSPSFFILEATWDVFSPFTSPPLSCSTTLQNNPSIPTANCLLLMWMSHWTQLDERKVHMCSVIRGGDAGKMCGALHIYN